jgi:hypothetical protein
MVCSACKRHAGSYSVIRELFVDGLILARNRNQRQYDFCPKNQVFPVNLRSSFFLGTLDNRLFQRMRWFSASASYYKGVARVSIQAGLDYGPEDPRPRTTLGWALLNQRLVEISQYLPDLEAYLCYNPH